MRQWIIGFVVIAHFSMGYGQDEISPVNSFALSPKFGVYGSTIKKHPIEGAVIGVEANLEIKRILFAADYYYFNEMSFFGNSEELNQIGCLFGQQIGKRNFRFQYQLGPALLWGKNPKSETIKTYDSWGNVHYTTNYYTVYYSVIGAELKISCHWLLTRYFGLGFDLHGNINYDRTVFFPLISLELGKLK